VGQACFIRAGVRRLLCARPWAPPLINVPCAARRQRRGRRKNDRYQMHVASLRRVVELAESLNLQSPRDTGQPPGLDFGGARAGRSGCGYPVGPEQVEVLLGQRVANLVVVHTFCPPALLKLLAYLNPDPDPPQSAHLARFSPAPAQGHHSPAGPQTLQPTRRESSHRARQGSLFRRGRRTG